MTKGANKNGQSIDKENIGHKTNKIKNTTQKTKRMSNTDPIKKPGVNPGEGGKYVTRK